MWHSRPVEKKKHGIKLYTHDKSTRNLDTYSDEAREKVRNYVISHHACSQD